MVYHLFSSGREEIRALCPHTLVRLSLHLVMAEEFSFKIKCFSEVKVIGWTKVREYDVIIKTFVKKSASRVAL